jgi:dihydrofolate reductase
MELEMIVQILNSKIKMNSDEIVMERKTANLYRKKFPPVNRYYASSIKLLFSERSKLTACKFSEVTISKQLSRAVMYKGGSIEGLYMKAVARGGIC